MHKQSTRVDSVVSTRAGGDESVSEQHFSYPLRLNYSFVVNADGTATQITNQRSARSERDRAPTRTAVCAHSNNQVHATDTLQFDASFNILGHFRQSDDPELPGARTSAEAATAAR